MIRAGIFVTLLACMTVTAQDNSQKKIFREKILERFSFTDSLLREKEFITPFYPSLENQLLSRLRVSGPPIPFMDGHLLLAYFNDGIQNGSGAPIPYRSYSLAYLSSTGEVALSGNLPSTRVVDRKPVITPIQDIIVKCEVGDFIQFLVYDEERNKMVNLESVRAPATLRLYRNRIFARYGYEFQSEDLRQYFSKYAWYQPRYKNVDKLLTSDEKAFIAAIQQREPGVHYYKPLPAIGLPDKVSAIGRVIAPAVAAHFFSEVSAEQEYTVAIHKPLLTNGGYVLGVTRSEKPLADGTVKRTHSFVFWKDGVTGLPVQLEVEPTTGPAAYPQGLLAVQEIFLRVLLPVGAENQRYQQYQYYLISGNDMYLVNRTPNDEASYCLNYLRARYGHAFKTDPAARAEFEKFAWYKPNTYDIDYSEMGSDEQAISTKLRLIVKRN